MICPNCIEPLIKDKKKLGQYSVWMICGKCGLRVRPDVSFELEIEIFELEKKRINSNKNKFDEDI